MYDNFIFKCDSLQQSRRRRTHQLEPVDISFGGKSMPCFLQLIRFN